MHTVAWFSSRGLCATPWYLIWQGHPKCKHLITIMWKSLSMWALAKIFRCPCPLASLVSIEYVPFLPVCPGNTPPPPEWPASPIYLGNQPSPTVKLKVHLFFSNSQSCVLAERCVSPLQNTMHWVRALCWSVSSLDYQLCKIRNYTVCILVSNSSSKNFWHISIVLILFCFVCK